MHEEGLAFNNLQGLICSKTELTNQPWNYRAIFYDICNHFS